MKKYIPILFLAFFIHSCCQDHSEIIPGQNFIPDDILQDIIDNGQVINEGFNPPKLEGKYRVSPQTLVSSNFNDALLPGFVFVDLIIEFKNFNATKQTVDVFLEEVGENMGEGKGSFVSGEGNQFTVYVEINTEDNQGHKLLQADVYSGTLEPNGIINLQRSLFMIEDNGDPNNEYIENGQGRLIDDNDGFSEKI